jgi:hypothetical protein
MRGFVDLGFAKVDVDRLMRTGRHRQSGAPTLTAGEECAVACYWVGGTVHHAFKHGAQ